MLPNWHILPVSFNTNQRFTVEYSDTLLERCLLFLSSDVEFQWPPPKFRLWYGILRLLGFGRTLKQREEEEMSIGDVDVWPFLRKAEYEEVSHKVDHR